MTREEQIVLVRDFFARLVEFAKHVWDVLDKFVKTLLKNKEFRRRLKEGHDVSKEPDWTYIQAFTPIVPRGVVDFRKPPQLPAVGGRRWAGQRKRMPEVMVNASTA